MSTVVELTEESVETLSATGTIEAPCPAPEDLDLASVLGALSAPHRLRIVAELAAGGERCCGHFELPVAKSTCSHHFRVLREAGLICQRIDGKNRYNRLRRDALEQRFPGLLDSVLRARALD
jgi:DNA-binding transcriptional ArsR family regulator